jgi:iron-sulfur cluster insertion protein
MSLTVTQTMIEKVIAMREAQNNAAIKLRVTVEGGGCSGFQYIFKWDSETNSDDIIIDDVVVTDSVSIPFLEGSDIDYKISLMGEEFKVTNPNASSGCGCGTSFAV